MMLDSLAGFSLTSAAMDTYPPGPVIIQPSTTITDIDIPFGRLVVIILKFMLASIPAVLVIYAIIGMVTLFIMAIFGGVGALSHSLSK
jgi:hypothetical protein